MTESVKLPVCSKTLSVCLHVKDRFTAELKDDQGIVLKNYAGSAPDIAPNFHVDYIEIDIDIDTGALNNWRIPTPKGIETIAALIYHWIVLNSKDDAGRET